MYYLGLDPGVSGGWALLDEAGTVCGSGKLNGTPHEIVAALRGVAMFAGDQGVIGMLERVHSLPKQGHSGAFTFGKNVGHIEASLAAVGIAYDQVAPVKWMNAMAARTGGDKRISKARAEQLFPRLESLTHAIADALLIAEYGRRLHRGSLGLTGDGTNGKEDSTSRKTTARRVPKAGGDPPAPGAPPGR